jgi:hypothetical protein
MSNGIDSHGIGDVLKGTQENGQTCFHAICLQKIMPYQSFCLLQNMTHEQRNMKTFQNAVEMEMSLNGDDSHAIGNALRRHVRK